MLNRSLKMTTEQEKLDLYSEYISTGLFKELDIRKYCIDDLSVFEDVDIINCILDGVMLADISFCSSYLYYSSFKKSKLLNIDFNHATLDYVDFTDALLIECRLTNTDCMSTIFRNTDLTGSNLKNMYFLNNDFRSAILKNVDISNSTFNGTILMKGITLENVKGIDRAHFDSINIGTNENPIILEDEEAKKWLLTNNHS